MMNYAVKCILAPEIAQNEGCNRPVTLIVPEGTVLNPRRPAAVSVRHLTQQALADCVLKAMAPLAPGRASAGCQVSFPTFCAGGFDDRPEKRNGSNSAQPYYVISDIVGGGMGGHESGDGMDVVDTHGGNCALLSAEVMETLSPFRVTRSELVPGSGGAGQHRGGLGIIRDYEHLSRAQRHRRLCAADAARHGALGPRRRRPRRQGGDADQSRQAEREAPEEQGHRRGAAQRRRAAPGRRRRRRLG